jgi:hypothetical protein
MDSTSADVARRRDGAGSRARVRGLADDAIVEALDHVFQPLDDLRHERFQSEARPAGAWPATPEDEGTTAEYWQPAVRSPRAASPRLLLRRVRYSKRAPYRQLRSAFVWAACIAGVCALIWLILRRSS